MGEGKRPRQRPRGQRQSDRGRRSATSRTERGRGALVEEAAPGIDQAAGRGGRLAKGSGRTVKGSREKGGGKREAGGRGPGQRRIAKSRSGTGKGDQPPRSDAALAKVRRSATGGMKTPRETEPGRRRGGGAGPAARRAGTARARPLSATSSRPHRPGIWRRNVTETPIPPRERSNIDASRRDASPPLRTRGKAKEASTHLVCSGTEQGLRRARGRGYGAPKEHARLRRCPRRLLSGVRERQGSRARRALPPRPTSAAPCDLAPLPAPFPPTRAGPSRLGPAGAPATSLAVRLRSNSRRNASLVGFRVQILPSPAKACLCGGSKRDEQEFQSPD